MVKAAKVYQASEAFRASIMLSHTETIRVICPQTRSLD
jgi:hypothetical protein